MNEAKAGSGERKRRAAPDAKGVVPRSFSWLWRALCPNCTGSYLGWGALSALGRPGIDLPLLFVAMVGVLVYGGITAPSVRVAGVRALLFGVAATTPIAIGAQSWGWLVPAGMMFVGTGFYVLPLGLLTHWTHHRVAPRYGVPFVGLAWTIYGWLAGALDVPLAGMSQALIPSIPSLLGGARLVGTAMLEGSLAATLFAAAATAARSRGTDAHIRIWRAGRVLFVGSGALVALSACARLSAPPGEGKIRVGLVQVNAGAEYHGARLEIPAMQRAFDRQLEGLLGQLTDVELVVMPETFDGRYTLMLPDRRDAWSARAKKWRQAYLLTSYLSDGSGLKSNAAGLIDAQGALTGVHRKVVLAPHGERGLRAGEEYRALPLNASTAVGVTICQESMSSSATRSLAKAGAALLVATSSDISFGSSLVPFEHLAATRLRAIETGRSILWASNAGPSGIIDRWGSSPGLAPFRRAVAIKAAAELHRETTPYLQLYRHWLVLLLCALAALVGLMRREPSPKYDYADDAARAHGWGAAVPGAGLLGLVLLTLPALVELRHGSSPRALAAVADLWSREATLPFRANLDRFYTAPDRSYAGAIALFMSYYGYELGREDVPAPAQGSLAGVQQLLRERYRFDTRMLSLGEGLPSTAALVELGDGSFGVLASPTGQPGWLLTPAKHAVSPIDEAQRAELRRGQALVPSGALEAP